MPPRSDCACSKPWLRSQTATFIDLMPMVAQNYQPFVGIQLLMGAGRNAPMGIARLPSMCAVSGSHGSRTSMKRALFSLRSAAAWRGKSRSPAWPPSLGPHRAAGAAASVAFCRLSAACPKRAEAPAPGFPEASRLPKERKWG